MKNKLQLKVVKMKCSAFHITFINPYLANVENMVSS